MAIETDLNVSPYFDDFDETKNFHRVLFKPAVAVQARELTQLQTILQNQIERFGDNVLSQGTIIKGCNFVEVPDLGYIKILDLQTDGQPVSMSNYVDLRAVGLTTGIEAKVITVATGLVSQTPDLNTLFVKYLGTGSSDQKTFSATENIELRNFSTGEVITTVTAAGTVDGSSVGFGYATRISDGVIYQKGNFVRVDAQLTVISKYTNSPDQLVVGFETTESIVNSNNDTSLLDNANGFNNFNAPGADRLKLTSTLTTKTLAAGLADENFLIIQEYAGGRVVRKSVDTQYQRIFDAMHERTKDESGNYTVNDYAVNIEAGSNTDFINITVGQGKSYVEGRKVELIDTIRVPVEKATETAIEEAQTIATNIGNYVLVDEYFGNFDPHIATTVDLYDTALQAANNSGISLSGSKIGEAKVRSVVYESGTEGDPAAVYRIYIFDINMNSGETFNDVASLYYNSGTSNEDGAADLVSTTIFEPNFKRAIFPSGRSGLAALPSSGETADFIHRTVDNSLTLAAAATSLNIVLSSGEWPYTGTLNNTQKRDIILISKSNDGAYEVGKVINIDSATVSVSGSTLTVSGLTGPTGDVDIIAYYNVKKTVSQPAGKDLETVYVKIDCSNNVSNTDIGDYSLGLPDVYEIDNIYVGTTYSTSNPDRKGQYIFNTGQKDTHYGLSSIKKRKFVTLTSSDKLLVKAKVFKKNISSGEGFFSINSYPIDDANTANTSAITTEEIPRYVTDSGALFDLRNSVDFRPYAANTAAYAATIGAATINPSATVSFGSNDLFIPTPNEDFETDFTYYLPRKDLLVINDLGRFETVTGESSQEPSLPPRPNLGMVVASINIPVYPSLPKILADQADRPEYGVTVLKNNNRRYTMKDISDIDQRLNSLFYYTALNTLELRTRDLLITDAAGNDRFKNGIFVDNFSDLSATDVRNIAYGAAINPTRKVITPKIKQVQLDLEPVATWSNVDQYDDIATLQSTSEVEIISQPFATALRTVVTDSYRYEGVMTLTPDYDSGYDVTRSPALNMEIDLVTPFVDYTDALNEFVPLTNESVSSSISRVTEEITISNNYGYHGGDNPAQHGTPGDR